MNGRRPSSWLSLGVLAVGLLVTAGLALTTRTAHQRNEQRLVEQRTREAAAVLDASIPAVDAPLATVANLTEVAFGGDGAVFAQALGNQVGPTERFLSVSLWPVTGTAPTQVVGEEPELASEPANAIEAFLDLALRNDGLTVLDLLDDPAPRFGYGYTASGRGASYVVYAEAALPADRTSVQRSDSAFAGLAYALYLDAEVPEKLIFASTGELPLEGSRSEAVLPFGDRELLLVMSPREDLGGPLLARLPWFVLGGGLLLTTGGAALTEALQRRRRSAVQLADRVSRLLADQRESSQALQASLLPQDLPEVSGLEFAVRYAPGVAGTQVGGDWYDVVVLGESRVMLVMGDVSGRGLAAASAMTSVRHTIRTLVALGHGPQQVLTELAQLRPLELHGHFATVLCCEVDLATSTVTIANAGHPPPLLIDGSGAAFLPTLVGAPVGVRVPPAYEQTQAQIPAGACLLLVTDGLFERRDEPIDDGLERLRAAAAATTGSLRDRLDDLLELLHARDAADDAAILGVLWLT